MKVICKYIVFMLFIYNFNIFNIDAEKPFSGTLNKVYACMHVWNRWKELLNMRPHRVLDCP